jgi:phenylalanyl-tRNA synthetase beta chain
MKISVNWIQQFLDFELPPVDELVARIGSQLGEVEEVIDVGAKYQGVLVAKVVECAKHENADHLNVCKIDDGGAAQNVERAENGLVQVVCGAPNVRAGLLVAWLPPGSTVPESYDKDPFVLEARTLRGVKSNGMLASARELAINDDHDGILEINEITDLSQSRHSGLEPESSKKGVAGSDASSDWIPSQAGNDELLRPGDDFAEVFSMDDYIIDIENKMFTHRPDCFGMLGIAREVAGIYGQAFTSPDWYQKPIMPQKPHFQDQVLEIAVDNEVSELVPRFMVVAMSDVAVKPSPLWLQVALAKIGQKPINNVVDLTNFYMQLTGQPLHAYDYDKVKKLSAGDAKIVVRYPQKGEKIKLLNGKKIEPREQAIMIATDKTLIGLGGVMGGSETEVDASTKNIILECASFDMYSIRRTSMAHGLFTDAVTRFTKGQSPLQNDHVMVEVVGKVQTLANGNMASQLIDYKNEGLQVKQLDPRVTLGNGTEREKSIFSWGSTTGVIVTENTFINDRLGLDLSPTEICNLLRNVELRANEEPEPNTPNQLEVIAPFWRTDLETSEDIVEEVGRLYGYDRLPLALPSRSLAPAQKDPLLGLKSSIRHSLAKAGASEVLTYSFVHGNLLDKVGQDKAQAYQLANALSPDLQYYRLSLTPSLLDKIHGNIKAGYKEFALFELGKAHDPASTSDDGLPYEYDRLALAYAASQKQEQKAGAAYYYAQKLAGNLLRGLGITSYRLAPYEPELADNPTAASRAAPFASGRRSAILASIGASDDVLVGIIGEYTPSVQKALKLPSYAAGFELEVNLLADLLAQASASGSRYVPLPRYPKVTQDITLKVASDLPYQKLYDFLTQKISELKPEQTLASLAPLGIYQAKDDASHKNVSFRLAIADYQKTMKAEEVNKLLDQAASAASQELSAERI